MADKQGTRCRRSIGGDLELIIKNKMNLLHIFGFHIMSFVIVKQSSNVEMNVSLKYTYEFEIRCFDKEVNMEQACTSTTCEHYCTHYWCGCWNMYSAS